jgi:hypothetical protein
MPPEERLTVDHRRAVRGQLAGDLPVRVIERGRQGPQSDVRI